MARRQRLVDRREQLGLSLADVAFAAGLTTKSIGRYEAGTSTPRGGDRRAYAGALQWDLVQLSVAFTDDPQPVNGHAVPGWLGHLASLEQAAAHVSVWEPFAVHGLLQTEPYALAVERADVVDKSEDAIARRVETRMARQLALYRVDPLAVSVVLDESVLLRVAGDRSTMADQLDHLLAVGDRPNVDLRVLPLRAGRFSAAFGSFSLYVQPGATEPFMAVTEDRAGPHYLDRPHELDAHTTLFAHLSAVALDEAESVDLIGRVAKEYQ